MPKEIVITNAYKEQLVGNLHTADTKDLVIVCHGLGRHKDDELIIAICKSFQEKEGLNSFRFNFSGTKQSEGKPEDSYYTKQASDLCSVIDYFSIRGYQIKSILGHSIGATATIIQAAKDRRIASIILIAPRIKPSNSIIVKEIIESGKTLSEAIESTETIYSVEIKGKKGKGHRTYHFSKRYLEELRDIDIVGYLKQVKIPTLILRGTDDDVVPKEEVKEACKANEVVRHIAIKGAGHTFKKSEDKDKLISEILQWYESMMKRLKKGYLIFGYYAIFGLALLYGILALWGGYLEAVSQLLPAPIIFLFGGFKALFTFLFLPILNCCAASLPFLKKTLEVDLGISWAILALISMLTLTYVQLINRLSKYLDEHTNDWKASWQRASWQKVFLTWTTGMHFVTILFLALRITYLSFDPLAYLCFDPLAYRSCDPLAYQNSCSNLTLSD